MTHDISNIADGVATLFKLKTSSVCAAIELLEAGETVSFIARYRKAHTAGMKHAPLRAIVERLEQIHALRERREVMFEALAAREKLTPELERMLMAAETRATLEDIYLPHASKQKSPAARARDAGLEPLADALLDDATRHPEYEAAAFVNVEAHVHDAGAALAGARQILMERWAQNLDVVAHFREYFWEHGVLTSVLSPESKSKKPKKAKSGKNQIVWSEYVEAEAPIKTMPLRRVHMLFRGRREAELQLSLSLPDATYGERYLASSVNIADSARPADSWLMDTVRVLWEKKLAPKLEAETLARLRSRADEDAVHGLSKQLRGLLFAAPAPRGVTMGLFFERRSGVSVAVVDERGAVLDDTSVFPFSPDYQWEQALSGLAKCLAKHQVRWVVTGNNLGFREAERLLSTLAKRYPDMPFTTMRTPELGALAYAACDSAAQALPDVHAPCRAAVSMARRFQNPLEELIKMPPRAMVLAPHQHDMNQHVVARALAGVMTDCVNAVGVDVNTASTTLLGHVSGLDVAMADVIVAHRETHGAFKTREQLKAVPGLNERIFQQAAGFLYVLDGDCLLDTTRIHPKDYVLVEQLLKENNLSLADIFEKPGVLDAVDLAPYAEACDGGLSTLQDWVHELRAPGRDPRPAFRASTSQSKPKPKSKRVVTRFEALKQDMSLEGVVRRITSFGAFVDVGAEQHGLVHISALADKFVEDPHQLLSVGDVVKVRVLELDLARRRLSLTMRTKEKPKPVAVATKPVQKTQKKRPEKRMDAQPAHALNTAMADAFAKLKRS
ncbi:MAG: Tex-like N-terminal domain-containing protein [Legionellaceae bacterium]|nr:Tex-like N-terminal domain-containing protein [Legionellaceae bacterium]